jgi:hypothetical protein
MEKPNHYRVDNSSIKKKILVFFFSMLAIGFVLSCVRWGAVESEVIVKEKIGSVKIRTTMFQHQSQQPRPPNATDPC